MMAGRLGKLSRPALRNIVAGFGTDSAGWYSCDSSGVRIKRGPAGRARYGGENVTVANRPRTLCFSSSVKKNNFF